MSRNGQCGSQFRREEADQDVFDEQSPFEVHGPPFASRDGPTAVFIFWARSLLKPGYGIAEEASIAKLPCLGFSMDLDFSINRSLGRIRVLHSSALRQGMVDASRVSKLSED